MKKRLASAVPFDNRPTAVIAKTSQRQPLKKLLETAAGLFQQPLGHTGLAAAR